MQPLCFVKYCLSNDLKAFSYYLVLDTNYYHKYLYVNYEMKMDLQSQEKKVLMTTDK